MLGQKDIHRAAMLAIGLAILTSIPYAVASCLSGPEGIFSGFLVNPLDGFSYLAKMRQGYDGEWTFVLPYAADAGPGSTVFLYFLFLGHVARWLGLPLIGVYHAARALFSITMMLAAFLLFRELLPDRKHVWTAYWLTLVGGGVGWIGIPFGWVPTDLGVPESIPLLVAYVNAHFSLAATAFLVAILAVKRYDIPANWRVLLGATAGLILAITLPFVLASLLPMLIVWLAWEVFRILVGERRHFSLLHGSLLAGGGVLLGALPWLGYYYWLTKEHPAIAAWTSQNLTPSPPPVEYLLGYGFPLVFALSGAVLSSLHKRSDGRLLITWVAVTAFVLYAPFGLQRRANLGLFFALAAMSTYGIHSLASRRLRAKAILVIMILLSLPSHLIVVASGLTGVARGEPILVVSTDDMGAFEWLSKNAGREALVLASPINGNRIPAFASVKVIYGHPMETPHAEERAAWVESLYTWGGAEEDALQIIGQEGVDYVLLGELERDIGDPEWVQELEIVHRSGDTIIYQVPPE